MGATRKRGPYRDELEVSIARVLKASPAERARHRKAFTFLRERLARQELEEHGLKTTPHGGTAHPNGPTHGPSHDSAYGGRDIQPDSKVQETIVDLYLFVARNEANIIRFFEEGGYLLCLEQLPTTKDPRVQDYACERCDIPQDQARFRRLLSALSLAAEYQDWVAAYPDGPRTLAETKISNFVRERAFPDERTASEAISVGLKYLNLERRYPGTSAIFTFYDWKFARAGPIEELGKQFELEEVKFIPELGSRFHRFLQHARQVYSEKLSMASRVSAAEDIFLSGNVFGTRSSITEAQAGKCFILIYSEHQVNNS